VDSLYRLYDAIEDMVLVVDRATFQILHANQAARNTTGDALARLRAMTLPALFPELDHARLDHDLARLATQPQIRYEELLRLDDGSSTLCEVRLNLGQIGGEERLICVVLNLSNQQTVEWKLQGSRILYRSLMDAVPDLLFRIRRDGTYLDYKVPAHLGLPVPEPRNILGKKIAEVVPEYVAELAMPAIERVARDGKIETIEYSIQEPDGQHHYEARFVPSADQEVIAVVRDITRYKRTEADLRASEEMMRALLNASGDVAILATIDGIILATNEPTARRFGKRVEELIGSNVFDYLSPDVAAARREIGERIRQTGEDQVFEDTSRGTHFVNHVFPFFDTNHQVYRLAVFARDVTEERRTQGILKRQRLLLEGVAAATNRLLANLDYQSAIDEALRILVKATEVNQVAIYECRLNSPPHIIETDVQLERTPCWQQFGAVGSVEPPAAWEAVELGELVEHLSSGEVVLNPFSTSERTGFPGAEHPDLHAFLLVPIFVSGDLWGGISFDDRHIHREWSEEEINILRMMAASIGAAIERQRTETRLRQERQMAETLREVGTVLTSTLKLDEVLGRLLEQVKRVIPYDAANVMLIENGVTRAVRAVGYEQFGLSPQKVEVITFDLAKAATLQKMIRTRAPAFSSDTLADEEWTPIPGTEWLRSWMGSPIIVRGEVVGMFSLDSAQKDFYGPEHLAMIAPFARQAAIAVENAKLFADVEELERVKSQMIRIASHDLRSPLARIQLVVRYLENQLNSLTTSPSPELRLFSDQVESLNTIRDSAREMEQIISDILSLERIETSIHTSEPLHWGEMVEHCVETLCNDLKAKNHHLKIDCAPDLPAVRGIAAQLEHAVLNLINNAIKYTPAGGEIEVRVYPKMYGDRLTIAFEVQDNGIGIPADQQALLFEPFYRARQAGTEHIPGAGMGLSVVKVAVEYHKGRVYVDSAPGEGSLFGFWIPV